MHTTPWQPHTHTYIVRLGEGGSCSPYNCALLLATTPRFVTSSAGRHTPGRFVTLLCCIAGVPTAQGLDLNGANVVLPNNM